MKKALLSMVMAFALVGSMAGCAQAPDGNAPADGTGTAGQAVEAACQSEDANAGSEVKSYVVSRVDGEPDWESIPQLEIDNQQWLEPVVITAHAQLCYSDEAFYVRMWAEEANVRAEYPESDLLAKTYEDSCLEFFISPVPGDSRYLNFEFNPNCAVGAEIGATKAGRTRLVRSDDPYNAAATRTENGWEITYQVPFDLIRQLTRISRPNRGRRFAATSTSAATSPSRSTTSRGTRSKATRPTSICPNTSASSCLSSVRVSRASANARSAFGCCGVFVRAVPVWARGRYHRVT